MENKEPLATSNTSAAPKPEKIKKLRYRDQSKSWSALNGKKKLELIILITMVVLVVLGVLLGVLVGLYV